MTVRGRCEGLYIVAQPADKSSSMKRKADMNLLIAQQPIGNLKTISNMKAKDTALKESGGGPGGTYKNSIVKTTM